MEREIYDDGYYQQQQNQDPYAAENQPSGGGPQGGESQQANEPAAVNQALDSPEPVAQSAPTSPVNADGSISTAYGTHGGGGGRESTEGYETDHNLDTPIQGTPAPMPPDNTPTDPNRGWVDPKIQEVEGRWNGGSPPSTPLPVDASGNTTHGWEWNGWDWVQVPGKGLGFGSKNVGYVAPVNTVQTPRPPGGPGGGTPTYGGGGGGGYTSSFGGFNLNSNMSPYSPHNLPQFQGPDQKAFEQQQLKALSDALNTSEWGPQRIAGMKEAQKEQALRMRSDFQREVGDRFAGAGRSGAGAQEALLRRSNNDTMGQILNSYRGVDENAAQNRRAELLTTASALGGALDSQMGRGVQGYGAQFTGAQGMADEAYRSWQSQMQIQAAALQKAIAEESMKLDWSRFGETARQFNERMGFDWTKMNLDQVPR